MNVDLFDYELPEALIAQTPLANRTASRLLALDKTSGDLRHLQFEQLRELLQAGDILVLNDTRVIPARLFGIKPETGARAEVLLLKALGNDRWEALLRPAKRFKKGTVIVFGSPDEAELPAGPGTAAGSSVSASGMTGEPLLQAVVEEEGDAGSRILRFSYRGIFAEILDRLGRMPLPPYIKEQLSDQNRYQTVYARHEGSAAAPTAGLHFTEAFLERLRQEGITIAYVTLHVGLGTFRPVTADTVEQHEMHEEFYTVPPETAAAINQARASGGRVVAVGTTSARTLETAAQLSERDPSLAAGMIKPCSGWTGIFIYPGYRFRLVNALLTNFHLPKSTLLMLISALAGRENVLRAYRAAVEQQYRFFSFGDAMFIY